MTTTITRKSLLAIAAAVTLLFGTVFAAGSAQAYEPQPTGTTSTTTPGIGEPFIIGVGANSFTAGSTVVVTAELLFQSSNSQNQSAPQRSVDIDTASGAQAVLLSTTTRATLNLGSGTAASDGSFSKQVVISQAGEWRVFMTGELGGEEAIYYVDVNVGGGPGPGPGPTPGPTHSPLPDTGANDNTVTIAAVGAGVLLVGIIALIIAANRRNSVE